MWGRAGEARKRIDQWTEKQARWQIFVSPRRPRLKKRANFGERARKSRLLLLFHPDFNWRDNHLIAQQTTFCYHQLYTRLAARNGQCQCWFIMPPRLLALALSHSHLWWPRAALTHPPATSRHAVVCLIFQHTPQDPHTAAAAAANGIAKYWRIDSRHTNAKLPNLPHAKLWLLLISKDKSAWVWCPMGVGRLFYKISLSNNFKPNKLNYNKILWLRLNISFI